MKKIIVLSLIATIVSHCAGKYFGLYNQFSEYDSLMHLLGGIFAGSLGIYLADTLKQKNYYLFSLSSAFVIGALWELNQRYVQKVIYPTSDIVLDMIMDVFGGIILVLILSRKSVIEK